MQRSTSSKGAVTVVIATAVAAATWFGSRRGKKAKRSKRDTASKTAMPSPFEPGFGCTVLSDNETLERWLREVAAPLVLPRVEAYAVPHDEYETARKTIGWMVDDVFRRSVPECVGVSTEASREIWKWLWCDVAIQLATRGKINEELEDILDLCIDPTFYPQDPGAFDTPQEHPLPPIPTPQQAGAEPMQASVQGPPSNLRTVSTREELSEIGFMRFARGTVAGASLRGPSRHLVLFAYHPAWPDLPQARGDLLRIAADNPRLSFVEVSLLDTQRHFGKPENVNEVAWGLTAAAPDGRVYPNPIAREVPADPPSGDQWAKMVAFASGFVGAPRARGIATPRSFGDLVRSMAVQRRAQVGVVGKPVRRTHGQPPRHRQRKRG